MLARRLAQLGDCDEQAFFRPSRPVRAPPLNGGRHVPFCVDGAAAGFPSAGGCHLPKQLEAPQWRTDASLRERFRHILESCRGWSAIRIRKRRSSKATIYKRGVRPTVHDAGCSARLQPPSRQHDFRQKPKRTGLRLRSAGNAAYLGTHTASTHTYRSATTRSSRGQRRAPIPDGSRPLNTAVKHRQQPSPADYVGRSSATSAFHPRPTLGSRASRGPPCP